MVLSGGGGGFGRSILDTGCLLENEGSFQAHANQLGHLLGLGPFWWFCPLSTVSPGGGGDARNAEVSWPSTWPGGIHLFVRMQMAPGTLATNVRDPSTGSFSCPGYLQTLDREGSPRPSGAKRFPCPGRSVWLDPSPAPWSLSDGLGDSQAHWRRRYHFMPVRVSIIKTKYWQGH